MKNDRIHFLGGLVMLWTTALTAAPEAVPFSLPASTTQLITAIAPTWDDSTAELRRWEKSGGIWKAVGGPVPVRLGKNGLAWGRGIHPGGLPGPVKQESDGRAPAGIFHLGSAYGYAPDIARKPSLPYHQVTASDLWVEDTESPDYNRHVRLSGNRAPATEWERKQQMKQDDPAHSLKLFIAHNAGTDIRAGAGSAIFFHIWRDDGDKPSSGCTVMAEDRLKELIRWTDPDRRPLYILLPAAVYQSQRNAWGLP